MRHIPTLSREGFGVDGIGSSHSLVHGNVELDVQTVLKITIPYLSRGWRLEIGWREKFDIALQMQYAITQDRGTNAALIREPQMHGGSRQYE